MNNVLDIIDIYSMSYPLMAWEYKFFNCHIVQNKQNLEVHPNPC